MKIIITRPAEDASAFAAMAQASGAEPILSPVMEIAPLPAIAPEGYDAVAFTSANGVRAFAAASADRAVPVFAVGAQTAAEARRLGFSDVHAAGGDAEALAAMIAAVAPRRTLHVAGAHRAGDLVARLAAAGLAAERAVFYEARPIACMTAAARAAFAQNAGVAFFSPRSVDLFRRQAEAAGFRPPFAAAAWCLSEAVAAAAADFAARRVAPEATAESLAALLAEHIRASAHSGHAAAPAYLTPRPETDAMPEADTPDATVREADVPAGAPGRNGAPAPSSASGTAAPPTGKSRTLLPLAAALVLALIAVALLWLIGRRPPQSVADAAPEAARLELPDEASAPPPEPAIGKILNDSVSQAKTGLETIDGGAFPEASVNELPPAPAPADQGAAHNSNAGLQQAAKAAATLFGNNPAADYIGPPPNSDAADESPGRQKAVIDRLERELADEKRARAQAAAVARRALAFAALKERIEAGEPFAEALADLRAAGGGQGLAALEPEAAAGYRTTEELRAAFAPARRAALAAGRAAEADGPLERIGVAVANLWGARPAGPVAGMSSAAVLSRAEAAVDRGDIAAALAEIETLRPPATAPFAQWRAEARARFDAQRLIAARAADSAGTTSTEDQP